MFIINLMLSFYMFKFNMICWLMFMMMMINKKNFMIEWTMMNINSMKIEYIIFFDWINFLFMSTVLLISSMVILYSMSYMNKDKFIKRFMILIMTFIMSMILMIISPNMISILLGWDGLGLSSYCLVAYYANKKSFNSSMITILMNRIGDIMIIITISLMMKSGSWNYMYMKNFNFMYLIMMATITKSAQMPFSSWLPMAMAAPTPVSSLVHSSTLVTAGVYLLIRFNYLMNKNFMYMLMMLASITMLMAGSSANIEFDIKKIIALSTLSQLSLMILTITLNLPNLAFFHLINHAMFKSLLFLCSGIIIHNYFNNQDIRLISLMNLNMPFINLTFNIASLTLCGMPFLTGFYSKDLIIEMFLMKKNNWLLFIMMFISMSLTTSYTFRLMYYISLKNLKLSMLNFYIHKNLMNYSIIILLFMSLFYGSILNWLMYSSINLIFLPKKLKLMIYNFLFWSIILSLLLMKLNFKYMKKIMLMLIFINSMWFLSIMMKKNKMNLSNINNKLLNMELNWSEFYMKTIWMKLFYKFFNMKKIYKLNFLMILISMMYMMIIIWIM
uniref:NADH-ubiquinone oxidoreductase chain 5 n=1 Tax=Acanthormius sp. QL-2013 TaxID=1421592 RepID=A0A0A6ZKS3_9HYME|nr:NADH dehydrogenase subunit 5 [Acanthormius sp. QL-2013]